MMQQEGRVRAIIENVHPEIDAGRFPVKRVVGEDVAVEADIFADGHSSLAAVLMYRHQDDAQWHETPMRHMSNDRWRGSFTVERIGRYRYTLSAWIDRFQSWRTATSKKVQAGQDVALDLLEGADLIEAVTIRATDDDASSLSEWAARLRSQAVPAKERTRLALGKQVNNLMDRYSDREWTAPYPRELEVVVDREKARFGAWYEMFPRSAAPEPGKHGTFKDCTDRLPYVASMGFDILYLPPVHPIGRTHRKGRNNSAEAGPHDPGSPWAIGSQEGGHKDVHPALGTLEDFRQLVRKAHKHGLETALDLAFQCSPDHPYVREHAEWFRRRPDGSVQYAENPPKRYEDIYPLDFECAEWRELWQELKSVTLFWIQQGIRVFRVDNPHTKPFRFWEWLISEVKAQHPDVIFLSEAFTRPKMMYRLAKLGFTQSYTYFTWRNTRRDLEQYLNELTRTGVAEYLSMNLWPNTPDILSGYLQFGGRPAFIARLVLAATLSSSYGIYGPAFELCEARPAEPGSEEYLDSEKYQVRHWDINSPGSLKDFIARVNRIRRQNPALQSNASLRFHPTDNDMLICYSKHNSDFSNVVLVVVNLDPHHTQGGWIEFPMEEMRLEAGETYQAHDLLSDTRFLWQGQRNYVELDPFVVPANVLQVRRRLWTERDFDYYL